MTKSAVAKVTDKVYKMGNFFGQVYLVRGKSCALIDSGPSFTPPSVIAGIEELGVTPEEIQYLILTHAHFDHICGVPGLLKAYPNLKIVASPIAAKVLAKEKVVAGFFAEDKAVVDSLLKVGMIKEYDSFQTPSTINVDMIMNEGDVLDLGDGCKLSFTLTPGHSPCSMSCYLSQGEVLFPGDVFGFVIDENTQGIFPQYFANYTEYINSIKKLSAIDASVLALSHTITITDKKKVQEFESNSLALHEEVHNFIIKDYLNNHSLDETVKNLFQQPLHYLEASPFPSASLKKMMVGLLARRSLEAENIAIQ